jgi:hypothetical protein
MGFASQSARQAPQVTEARQRQFFLKQARVPERQARFLKLAKHAKTDK